MSFSKKGIQTNDTKPGASSKLTALNPNAAEFVPLSLRSPTSVSTPTTDAATRFSSSVSLGKAVINRSESSISNNSEDEAHQFWRHQLPDDITPDFKVMAENESSGIGLSLAGLSLHDDGEARRYSASAGSGSGYLLNEFQELSPHGVNGNSLTERLRRSNSSLVDDTSSASFLHISSQPWDKQFVSNDQVFGGPTEAVPYNGSSRQGFGHDISGDLAIADDATTNALEFLTLNFPGFAVDSLADVYYANGCDLNLTIEMLTQLELQSDGAFSPNLSTKALSVPNLSTVDFPALSVPEGQNGSQKYGDELQHSGNSYQSTGKDGLLFKSSTSSPARGAVDFASAVKKLPSQDSGIWKYDRSNSMNSTVGSSRSSQILTSVYNSGHGRSSIYNDKIQHRASSRTAPMWLETGEAVANMYTDLREDARDHARLRNAYLEQARQAYLIGNKALAKELSAKGQYHNMCMKAAHGKAQESIYRQRNPVSMEMQGDGRGQDRMIDLHGLHVSEAIHVLKHELNVLRTTARAAEQRLQVYICVGTGHHTRGSRTPARLPVAVQHFLLEEGLDFSEPQPGLLRVVVY